MLDVAFSLLDQDEKISRAIEAHLPDLETFLYATRQEELGGRNGVEALTEAFRDARICMVLYRDGWGDTTWSGLEKRTIRDRVLEEGEDFLVLVRLDDALLPSWFPRSEFWVDYANRGAEGVARTIRNRLEDRSDRSALRRATDETADRRPMPISWYARQNVGQRQGSTSVTVPTEFEACVGCTKAVRFRPFVRAITIEKGTDRVIEESFCQPCAKLRGITGSVPPGWTREEAYADENPSVKDHVTRLLKRLTKALAGEAAVKAHGVHNVGATVWTEGFSLSASRRAATPVETPPIWFRQLESEGALSDQGLYKRLRSNLLTALDGPNGEGAT